MTKVKVLAGVVIGLVVVNIGMLVTLGTDGPGHGHPHRGPHGPKQMVIDRLQLDGEQIEAYERLIDIHQEAIRKKDQEILAAKEELFGYLTTGSTRPSDSLFSAIGVMQSDIERIHFQHFQDIRALCGPEQVKVFDSFVDELAAQFRPPRHGPER